MASWLESIFDSVLQNAAPIVGGVISNQIVTGANRDAVGLAREGSQAGIRSVNAGAAGSQQALNTITANAAPGAAALRQVVATNPGTMNPWQEQALKDAAAAASVAGSRTGSARQTAIINDGQNRLRAQFQKDNTARGDAAAGTMAGQGHQAAMQAAGIPMQAGQAEAGLEMGAANNAANATVANAGTQASTLAAIAGYANRNQADEQARQRYRTVTAGMA